MTCFIKSYVPGRMTFLSLLLLSFVLTGYPVVSSAADELSAVPAVLTLEEAANFLRLSQGEVVRLIKEDCLPGRRTGEQWRFSRAALLDWLALKENYSNCDNVDGRHEDAPETGKSDLKPGHSSEKEHGVLPGPFHAEPVHDMSSVAGRGAASPDSETGAAKPKAVGEKPEFQTAEDALLRGEQLLLKANQFTIEPGLFYSKSEQQGLTVTQLNNVLLLAFAEGEQDRFLSNVTLRYGMKYDLQLSVSVPYIYQKDTTTATIPGTTQTEEESDSRNEFGDIIAGLRHTIIKEGAGRPDVILNVEGHIPTRDSSFGIGGGVSLVKRLDPAVMFADIGYRRVFSREFDDPVRLQPEHIYTGRFGYALSLNDRLAINSSVSGTFTSHKTFDNPDLPDLPASELFNLNLSLTTLMSEKFYIDTSLSFALNGPRNVTLGISLPYTFGL